MCEGHGESEMAEFLDLVLVKSHLNFLMFLFFMQTFVCFTAEQKKTVISMSLLARTISSKEIL